MTKLYRTIQKALRESGLPWAIERGTKHHLIMLDGEQIGVLSNGNSRAHDGRNIMSKIKKKAKGC